MTPTHVDINSLGTQVHVPRWQRAYVEAPSVPGFNHKRVAESHQAPFYCANALCGQRMDHGDAGVVCATCRAETALRP